MKKKIRLVFLCAVGALCTCANAYGELNTTLFTKYIPITVSGYAGESTLTNFPVLVTLEANSPSGFNYADCAVKGSDLRFADSEGNLIPHEIDTWNTAGKSLIWVGVPVLTNGVAFTMYYGAENPGPVSAANLWSLAGYAGVWHLTDGHDSTTNGLDGTIVARITAAEGAKLGGALDFNNVKMSVGMTPNGDFTNGFSLTGWCWPKSTGSKALFGKDDAMSVRIEDTKLRLTTPGVLDHSQASCSIVANAWFHLGLTFLPNTATSGKGTVANQYKVYRDGVEKASLGASRIPNLSDSAEMWIGGNQWDAQNFEGVLDEFRLSYSILSADWIKAAYDTAANPTAFAPLGEVEQTDPSAPSVGELSVVAQDGAFIVTTTVSKNFPASIVCTVDGTDYPMTTSDASLPATYTATISGLSSGTYTAVVNATATSGTVVSVPGSDAFHSGALTVTKLSDADETSLKPGVFRIARADADSTGLPPLTFDVGFAGDALEAIVSPGVDSLTIPAGEAYVDISIVPTFAEDIDHDVSLVLTVSGVNVGAASSGSLTVFNFSGNPFVRYVATTGNDANDGLSAGNAKKTIASALSDLKNKAAGDNIRTVYVCDGDYAFDSGEEDAVTVDFPVLVTSLSGDSSKVSITRTGTSERLFRIDCADAVVSHLTLYGGAALTGGAVYMTSNGGTLADCVVSNSINTTWKSDGAVYIEAGRIVRCLLANNEYKRNGSALCAAGGVVESCMITGNKCGSAGAVCLMGGASIVNCTIVDNTGTECSGVNLKNRNGRVVNCAIFNNIAPDTVTGKVYNSNGQCFVNCAADLEITGGTGCLYVQPSFRDAANGDWHLSSASPLIDAGVAVDEFGAVSETDLSGNSRVVSAIDIGCFENSKVNQECGFIFSSPNYILPAEIEFTGKSYGFSGTPDYSWIISKEGSQESVSLSGASPKWTAFEAGVYSVLLMVSGAEGSVSYRQSACIMIAPAEIYTSPGNASAEFPYSTPATAAPDIATAVAAAVDGTTIHVLKGTYYQDTTINVEKGIRIIGATGNPSDVVCTNTVERGARSIMMIKHPDAFVAGLTMTGGYLTGNNSYGGCLRIRPQGGCVSNCVIRSGKVQHFNSYGAGAYIQAGIVTHTRFTGSFASCPAYNGNPSSSGVVAHIAGGKLENCLFDDITIEVANDGTSCGPLVSVGGGTMLNCTVVGRCQCAGTGNSTDGNFLKYDGGSGIYCGSSGWVKNCVSTCVTNMNGVVAPFAGTASRFVNCAGDGGTIWGGVDCVDGAPGLFFRDFGGCDYTPMSGGPLVNKGEDYEGMTAVDLAGKPRKVGKRIDIGCYEAHSSALILIVR